MKQRHIPDILKQTPQWLGTAAGEKRPRVAYPPHHYASTANADHYTDYTTALEGLTNGELDGIGFAVTEWDSFVIVDLDACRNPRTGELSQFAASVVADLGSYTEASKSGTGVHIVVQSFARTNMKSLTTEQKVEVFATKGFVILTGDVINGHDTIKRFPRERLAELMAKWKCTAEPTVTYHSSPPPDFTPGTLTTDDLLLLGPWLNLIVHGSEDGAPKHFPREADGQLDRSRALYAAVHELQRAGASAELAFHILQTSGWVQQFLADAEKSKHWLWRYNVEKVYKGRDGDLVPDDEHDDKPKRKVIPLGEAIGSMRPVDWLIHGYLERGSNGHLIGKHSSYKSTVAFDWAACVATGHPWKGSAVRRGPVVVIAGEGQRGLAKRFVAWGEEHEVDVKDADLLLTTGAVRIGDENTTADLDAVVREVNEELATRVGGTPDGAGGPPALVIVDTLAKNFAGQDENSSTGIAEFHRQLVEAFPASCILVVHHLGKDKSKGARGSSAIEADADFVFVAELVDSVERVVKLSCRKLKDADRPQPVLVQGKVREFTLPQLGGEVITGVTIAREFAKVDPRQSSQPTLATQVLAILDDAEGSLTLGALCTRMRDDGLIEVSDDAKKDKYAAKAAVHGLVGDQVLSLLDPDTGELQDGRPVREVLMSWIVSKGVEGR